MATSNNLPAITVQGAPPISTGARGLVLTSMDEMRSFAECVAKSGLAPKGLQSPEAIVVALQMGRELGMAPMASLQNIAVINGRPSVWGDAMLAVCMSSGVFDQQAFVETLEKKGDVLYATCTVRRLPNGSPHTRTFSMEDAKFAGLAGKEGPWKQYPKRMLQMRARVWALRDRFADILRGFPIAEEAGDMQSIGDQVVRRVSRSTLTDRLLGSPETDSSQEAEEPTAAEQESPETDVAAKLARLAVEIKSRMTQEELESWAAANDFDGLSEDDVQWLRDLYESRRREIAAAVPKTTKTKKQGTLLNDEGQSYHEAGM